MEGLLVGIVRLVTDFSYCCYLSDLAVNNKFQNTGIGKITMEKLDSTCKFILISASKALSITQRLVLKIILIHE